MSGAAEVYKLAADLSQVGPKSIPAMRGVMAEVGSAFALEWAANARETSGQHGKWYPDSIDSELAFDIGGISVDVGPNSAKKQGSMGRGFEFGSVNQPPHLDGLRALDGTQMRAERIIDSAIGRLFP
jgi:hypothetical protein